MMVFLLDIAVLGNGACNWTDGNGDFMQFIHEAEFPGISMHFALRIFAFWEVSHV